MKKPGLYANIHKKRKRIAAGSGEKMRKPGSKGAPTSKAFKKSAKTAKKMYGGGYATKMNAGGPVRSGIARACGKVMDNRRKVTKFY
jgi:signal recognition particle GTPase